MRGRSALSACPDFDADRDGTLAISELVGAVRSSVDGCQPPSPTPSPTSSPAPTATPTAIEFVATLLTSDFLISNFTANIALPGSKSMELHSDQGIVVPEPWFQPWSINIIWCLNDVDEENGATRYLPGSHKIQRASDLPPDARALLCEADAILALDWADLGGALRQAKAVGKVTAKIVSATLDQNLQVVGRLNLHQTRDPRLRRFELFHQRPRVPLRLVVLEPVERRFELALQGLDALLQEVQSV